MRLKLFLILFIGFYMFRSTYAQEAIVDTPINENFLQSNFDLFHQTVINGNLATNESQSLLFTVRILTYNDESEKYLGSCTGVIVARDLILTAGHCFKPDRTKAKVLFGLGGENGFTHEVTSRNFKYFNPRSGETTNAWENGRLRINEEKQREYYEYASSVNAWQNKAPAEPNLNRLYNDIALIKIPNIPRGYRSVKFFMGRPNFGQRIYAAGYGTNSVIKTENDNALRWSALKLIGHYTPEGENTIGLESYSPDGMPFCLGDSGGPLLIDDNGELKLLGTNIFVYNMCGGGLWSTYIKSFRDQLDRMAAELRSITNT